MIQNSPIVRYSNLFSLSVVVVATSIALPADAFSQIVSSDAFNETANHSILEVADETPTTLNGAAPSSTAPLTEISQSNSAFDAPTGPLPRMTGVKPLSTYSGSVGGNSSGTFAGLNPSKEPASVQSLTPNPNQFTQLQPTSGGNNLRPSPEDSIADRPEANKTSVGSFSDQPPLASNTTSGFTSSTTAVSGGANSTASIFDEQDDAEPKFESAYLHDQQPKRDTPVRDTFGSPVNSKRLTPPVGRTAASNVAEGVDPNERNFVQQTAFLSPAAPAQPQFQNGSNNARQNNQQQFGQQQTDPRGGRNPSFQQTSQNQRTRQRDLPRQNQSQNGQQSRNGQQVQNGQPSQTQTTDSSAAKEAIAKFSFDANQQLANGLPIRMIDFLQKSEGRASRNQLIPQYWEVYYDWAQSVSAKHHHDWVASIKSAKQADGSSIEIAKSNAQNEITFNAIQLGKSQAKMKSLTGDVQPIVPMDSPTVTRVKTNYEAFKNRGMIAPKFEGIDSTLMQMHGLIASRANTVAMAQKNANEAKQLYSRNQSTVDHVLSAGRTWRSAESDFIASVIEYNKAYADYALALPYGSGPVETVVSMLIVKPTTNQNVSSQVVNGRPNLSNDARSNTASYSSNSSSSNNNADGNDYSIPYASQQSGNQNSRAPQTRQASSFNRNGGNTRPVSNSTRLNPALQNNRSQTSAPRNLTQNSFQQSSPKPATQPVLTTPPVVQRAATRPTAQQPALRQPAPRQPVQQARSTPRVQQSAQPAQSAGFRKPTQPSTERINRPSPPREVNAITERPSPQKTAGFNNTAQPSSERINRMSQARDRNTIYDRSSVGTNRIQRPSQFPTEPQATTASPFKSTSGSTAGSSQSPQQPNKSSFDFIHTTTPPAGNKPKLPNPFTPAARSADSSTGSPVTAPKPPTGSGSSGFSFGG